MTLGLATCDDNGIYIAIESQGLPVIGGSLLKLGFPLLLDSKILQLNHQPRIVAVVAGGLEHWADVAANFDADTSVKNAAEKVIKLLDTYTNKDNQAYALVCGYEDDRPVCYRINRFEKKDKTEIPITEKLKCIQAVGSSKYAEKAKEFAKKAIDPGKRHPLVALVESIDSFLPGSMIRYPIHTLVIRP